MTLEMWIALLTILYVHAHILFFVVKYAAFLCVLTLQMYFLKEGIGFIFFSALKNISWLAEAFL